MRFQCRIVERTLLTRIGGDVVELMPAHELRLVRPRARHATCHRDLIERHVVRVAEVPAHLDSVVVLARIPAIETADRHGGIGI